MHNDFCGGLFLCGLDYCTPQPNHLFQAAIVAQIVFTGFSLNNLSQTHWIARALFVFGVISSLMAVYYATTQQRIMGLLLLRRS
jgi:hypothetical protein